MDDRRSELERILLANPSDAASRREYAELLLEAGDAQAARVQFELLAARPSGAETAGLRVIPGGAARVIPLQAVAEEQVRFSSIVGMQALKKTGSR